MQLAENQVSASSLAEVFGSAFMEVSNLEQSGFRVDGDKLSIGIEIDVERKYIKFNIINPMQGIDIGTASQIINKMNFDYILANFSVVEFENRLFYTAAYFMSYKKGLIKHQLVDNLKKFEQVVLEAGMSEFGNYF